MASPRRSRVSLRRSMPSPRLWLSMEVVWGWNKTVILGYVYSSFIHIQILSYALYYYIISSINHYISSYLKLT